MIYQTIVFHSNKDSLNDVHCSYHNYTLNKAVEHIKEDYPGENGAILVFHDGKWSFKGYLVDGDVI